MKKLNRVKIEFILIAGKIIGVGRIRVISTSKIRKITAIKKNRKEKGIRADLLGSNPHSKADGFSRSCVFFLAIVEFNRIRIRGNINEISRILIITIVMF